MIVFSLRCYFQVNSLRPIIYYKTKEAKRMLSLMRGTILERRKSDMVMALPVGALPIYLKRACPLSYNAWSQRL